MRRGKTMQKIRIWGWDKKVRTMLRFIKPGDIFCFKFNNKSYCFGRIIVKVTTGHLVEILDSYGLFDRKAEGEWRVIGHQEDYKAHDFDDIFLTFGIGDDWTRRDLYGNVTKITTEEHFKYIRVSPKGNNQVKVFVQEHIDELKEM